MAAGELAYASRGKILGRDVWTNERDEGGGRGANSVCR